MSARSCSLTLLVLLSIALLPLHQASSNSPLDRACLKHPYGEVEGCGGEPEWLNFSQRVDHFGGGDSSVFQQRYLVNDQYYKEGGPVLYYVGAEATLSVISVYCSQLSLLAQQLGGVVVGLEHRFYGDSIPFGGYQYLTIENALADFVYFKQKMVGVIGSSKSPWVASGGSYGGFLAAILRLKRPNDFVAAIAHSGPIELAIYPYEYYQLVSEAFNFGEVGSCGSVVAAALKYVNKNWYSDKKDEIMRDLHLCSASTSPAHINFVVRKIFTSLAEFNTASCSTSRYVFPAEEACRRLLEPGLTPVQALYQAMLVSDRVGSGCISLASHQEAPVRVATRSTFSAKNDALSWAHQVCSQYRTLSNSNGVTDMFLPTSLTWHDLDNACKRQFGITVDLKSAVNKTQSIYGGRDISYGSRIIFTNGLSDPVRAKSLTYPIPSSPTLVPLLFDGGHVEAGHFPSPYDSSSLTLVRQNITRLISEWLL